MEDNYYKKGKSQQTGCAQEPRASTFMNKSSNRQSKAQSQNGGRQSTGGTLKTNFNDLGKGRIVESSQSGFGVQPHTLQPSNQKIIQNQEELDASNTIQGGKVRAQTGPLLNEDMSANSNQRKGGRNSHDHFATLHQTPQPVVMGASNSGHSGSTTPLTHLIPRRQFEMTQLPKSNSVVCGGVDNAIIQSSHSYAIMSQHQALTMHLKNPKITSQSAQRNGESLSDNKKAAISGSLTIDRNVSSLSGGAVKSSHPHSRKGSSMGAKPTITKPQGGVFQSGADTNSIKIMTNNFALRTPHTGTESSPQFIVQNTLDKRSFATHNEFYAGNGTRLMAARTSDQLKNVGFEQQQVDNPQRNSHHHMPSSSLQSAQKSGGGTITQLTLNQQLSAGPIVGVGSQGSQASHFNTPSNCYQASQQQQLINLQTATQATSQEGTNPVRNSLPAKDPTPILLQNNDSGLNHLSQNSYELTAPLHMSTSQTPGGGINPRQSQPNNASLIGNLHQHSNSTLLTNMAQHVQNTSAQNSQQHQTNATNLVNFTQHTQQAHPNLQAAVQLNQKARAIGSGPNINISNNNAVGQGHLSASQFDISALLRQQTSTQGQQPPALDFQELCSNTTHHIGHQTQAALKMSVESTTRDIDFLKQRFYAEYGCDTNDILTLFSYWQSNFQSFVQPGGDNGNQTTAINALQIANISSYRQQQNHTAHQLTVTGASGNKSNNVTAFGVIGKSRSKFNIGKGINQHQTINFNSQSFENQTMTTSHIQPRKVSKLIELGQQALQSNLLNQVAPITQVQNIRDSGIGAGQDSTEIQHFTTTSVTGAGYPPFDMNQQMFFIASNPGQQVTDINQVKGRRTQPCIRQHSTASNRQNCTDTVSFHRDVPTPMMQREAHASIEAEDERNEFSFEEPAFDGTNEVSIEEEEKSLINALSFKKQIAPLQDGQHLHEIDNQRRWATVKQDATPTLPKYRNRPLSKDHCGFTIQLSPINRFAPSPRSKRSIFDFHALKISAGSMLSQGINCAKDRIKRRGSTNKDGTRKYFHRSLSTQAKALSILTRCNLKAVQSANALFLLKTALDVMYLSGGAQLAQMDTFRRLLPKRGKEYDSIENKTANATVTATNDRHESDVKRRRDKSMKGRGTSKSRKRQGSRNSRKARIASLYRESTSSIGEDSAGIPIFSHMQKNGTTQGASGLRNGQVVQDAETTQDIQKLCREIEEAEKNFADKVNEDADQFDKQVTRQVIQAERALQDSKRESRTRDQSVRGTRRDSNMSIADKRASNIKAQSLSSLNHAMQFTPSLAANATHRHLNPSELYGTKGPGTLQLQAQMNEPVLAAPNTERPNAHAIELRLAKHNKTALQKKRQQVDASNTKTHRIETKLETDTTTQRPDVKLQQVQPPPTKNTGKGGKRITMASLLDQKSEPCLLRPKKLSLDRQQVKLMAGTETNAQPLSAQKDVFASSSLPTETDDSRTTVHQQQQQQTAGLQSTSSMKRKLTFIKTKNINFHSVSKLSGRMQPSATATHQGAPGLRIKLQKTVNGDSTDRSGQELRFAAQTTCQSALTTHKYAGKDLATRFANKQKITGQQSNTVLLKNVNNYAATNQSEKSGITPSKPSGKIKYASARIKLQRDDKSHEKQGQHWTNDSTGPKKKIINKMPGSQKNEETNELGSPAGSETSSLGGIPHIRRLVEMLINEYYRKRGESIKTVQRDKQVDTLVEFWWQSLSHQKILCKLKGKSSKTVLVEKETYLLNFLNRTDMTSLLQLQKHSTTRKYGELAVLQEQHLRQALEDYLSKSQ